MLCNREKSLVPDRESKSGRRDLSPPLYRVRSVQQLGPILCCMMQVCSVPCGPELWELYTKKEGNEMKVTEMDAWSRCGGPGGISKERETSRGYEMKCWSGVTRTESSRLQAAEISLHWTGVCGVGQHVQYG
jgi:hypothetical protein